MVILIVVVPLISMLPDLLFIIIQKVYYPNPSDLLLIKENTKHSSSKSFA